ncbi:hypothetical protein DY000_02033978 [Brassica cretica]|uniref:Uncharacterized protein n=1 Tax=Brassica cretica TaxID=69181 RepID=A0ABQ7DXR7_BRACR|nr:hypothetical protein DY000_02033978 [Brassica cretica]
MLGTPTNVANVYVLTITPNKMVMLHRAPCLHQEFSLTRMCLRQLIISLEPIVASMVIVLEATKVQTLTMGSLFTCIALLTMDPHHEMATPQCLLDTIGQPHNVKVKVSDYNFTEKRHTISVTKFVCLPVLPDVRTTCGDQSPQTLKIHRSDYLNSATALHLAPQNSHPRCSMILLSECNQFPNCWSLLKDNKSLVAGFDQKVLGVMLHVAESRNVTG